MALTVEDLLLGGGTTHRVEIPPEVLRPAGGGGDADAEAGGDVEAGAVGNGAVPATVVLRPLVLADVQRIHKAARDGAALTSVLMVQQALVEPKATVDEVGAMHAGLVEFLLREVNRVSGLALAGEELDEVVRAPLARACFVLTREFGWTLEECAGLTLGQVLVYLEMLSRGERPSSREA